ncbi:hypothetical protein K3495_g5517 [Podosphaera aphanis]|nr:hypothetical protein K3495_g5517 [Podosphaera aphanis]
MATGVTTNKNPSRPFNTSHQHNARPMEQAQNRKCYICGKHGCWSSNHNQKDKDDAREKYRNQFLNKFDQQFEKYVAEFERSESADSEQMLEEIEEFDLPENLCNFETLMIEISQSIDDHNLVTEDSEQMFTTQLGDIDNKIAEAAAAELHNISTLHAIAPHLYDNVHPVSSFLTKGRSSSSNFHGIMVDTGAASKSTAGYAQFVAFQNRFGITYLDKARAGEVTAHFGIGATSSLGLTLISTPIGKIEFHIVIADTPFLLSLADMDRQGVFLNNLENKLVGRTFSVPIIRKFGHPFLIWGAATITEGYLSEPELRRLHRRFGHPSASRLVKVLERAGHNDITHRKILGHITKYCEKCQRFGNAPSRFKFTLKDDVDFNHCIYIDIFYIESLPVLHVVNEATKFQAARWLQNMTSQHVWESLRACWIDVYLGPPDLILHDAGSNFTAREFQQNASLLAINTKCAPVESANTMGIVERYHHPLRRAYQIIKIELEGSNKTLALQMAVKAINDTAGPDGIIPTLLVFGAYPRMSEIDPPAPSVTKRATAIRKAMEEVAKLSSARQVNDALRTTNGPRTDIGALPIGSNVLVWRSHLKKWEGVRVACRQWGGWTGWLTG